MMQLYESNDVVIVGLVPSEPDPDVYIGLMYMNAFGASEPIPSDRRDAVLDSLLRIEIRNRASFGPNDGDYWNYAVPLLVQLRHKYYVFVNLAGGDWFLDANGRCMLTP
jgi:hypothetical protein